MRSERFSTLSCRTSSRQNHDGGRRRISGRGGLDRQTGSRSVSDTLLDSSLRLCCVQCGCGAAPGSVPCTATPSELPDKFLHRSGDQVRTVQRNNPADRAGSLFSVMSCESCDGSRNLQYLISARRTCACVSRLSRSLPLSAILLLFVSSQIAASDLKGVACTAHHSGPRLQSEAGTSAREHGDRPPPFP